MPRIRILAVGLMLVLAACQSRVTSAQPTTVEYLTGAGRSGLPFSEAVRVGDMLYLSGQIGNDPQTNQSAPGASPRKPARPWRTSSARWKNTDQRWTGW